MAYNAANSLLVKNEPIDHEQNLQNVEYLERSDGDLSEINDYQTVTAANDLLQNGILVETSKG